MSGHLPGAVLKPLVKLGRAPDDCWSWLGRIDENGCAMKQFHGVLIPARRWVWMQLFGPIPAGKVITEIRGNRQCTNPFHLRCCTQAEACRATSATTMLAADVAEIRSCLLRSKQIAEAYADRFGVSPQTIRDIWRNDSWCAPRPFKLPAAVVEERC